MDCQWALREFRNVREHAYARGRQLTFVMMAGFNALSTRANEESELQWSALIVH